MSEIDDLRAELALVRTQLWSTTQVPSWERALIAEAERDAARAEVERLTKLVSESEAHRYRSSGELLSRAEAARAELERGLQWAADNVRDMMGVLSRSAHPNDPLAGRHNYDLLRAVERHSEQIRDALERLRQAALKGGVQQ